MENVILRAMAKNPLDRYDSVREMAADLDVVLELKDVPKFVPQHGDGQSEETRLYTPVSGAENSAGRKAADEAAKPRRRGWSYVKQAALWTLAVLLVMAVLGVGAYYAFTTWMRVPDVTMPNVVGKPYADAVAQLTQSGFSQNNIQRVDMPSNAVPPGAVFKQDPDAGITVKTNRSITLWVSIGQETVAMPAVENMPLSQAKQLLKQNGIPDSQIAVNYEYSDQPKDTVIRQYPREEVAVVPGKDQVQLVVSQGPQLVTVPNVVGSTEQDARQQLTAAGLTVGKVQTQPDYKAPSGVVIQQAPYKPGDQVPKGRAVDLWVSSGYPQDAKTAVFPVAVAIPPGHPPVQVKIVVTDAREANQTVVSETTSVSKVYPVQVVLSPDTGADIKWYVDGQQQGEKSDPLQWNIAGRGGERRAGGGTGPDCPGGGRILRRRSQRANGALPRPGCSKEAGMHPVVGDEVRVHLSGPPRAWWRTCWLGQTSWSAPSGERGPGCAGLFHPGTRSESPPSRPPARVCGVAKRPRFAVLE